MSLEINKDRYDSLPKIVKQMCNYGALITGSTAVWLLGQTDKQSDIDMVVPVKRWNHVYKGCLKDLPNKTLGGYWGHIGFTVDDREFDVWPADMWDYIQMAEKNNNPIVVIDINKSKVYSKESFVFEKNMVREDEEIPF